jgi:hypothetical protein
MGRLLFTLTDGQSYSYGEIIGDAFSSGTPKRDVDRAFDLKQRNAIQRVLAWMVGGSVTDDNFIRYQAVPSKLQRQYFEKTLMRMNAKGQKIDSIIPNWQGLLQNTRRLIGFHEEVTTLLADGRGGELRVINDFKKLIGGLAKDYKFYIDQGITGTDYYAYYIGDCVNDIQEQNNRKLAVGIKSDFQQISVMDMKGIS